MQIDSNLGRMRIPDILETIADLSNDEVFTPPDLANKVLDMLPEEIWSNSKIRFLDPATKTGIFLREITKRLIDGLEDEIPDLQKRVNHILTKQVFGLGITELTSLMSRRTLYCSTEANGKHSVCTEFDDVEGNIKFPDSEHEWNKNDRCEICGVNKEKYDNVEGLDNYAYSFIHDDIKEVFGDMKFDVIVGNPPYQMSVGNDSAFSTAIYNLFIDKAIELNPKYISMIIPSRWMSGSAAGVPKDWINKFTKGNKIKVMMDYEDSRSLFKEVGVAGGINYFLWDNQYNGKCEYTYHNSKGKKTNIMNLDKFNLGFVIRDTEAYSIIDKVEKKDPKYYSKVEKNFSSLVSPGHFFDRDGIMSTNWKGYKEKKSENNNIKYYMSVTDEKGYGWVSIDDVPKNKQASRYHKLLIAAAYGGLDNDRVLNVPRYGEPNSVSSQTYLTIGYKHNYSKKEILNIMTYVSTKFFRYMVRIKKITQQGPRGVYQFVPLQDWNEEWTDEKLYKKYRLTQEEIDHIENSISPMDISKELEIANKID